MIITNLNSLFQGIALTAKTVAGTLGPNGRLVLLENPDTLVDTTPFYVTQDGARVISEIKLPKNDYRYLGVELIKNAVNKLKEEVGDGSTTFTIIVNALLQEAKKYIAAGHDPIGISKQLKEIQDKLCTQLELISYPIETRYDLFTVAKIASKSAELAELITTAIELQGQEGQIIVEETKQVYVGLERISGYQLDRGYIHDAFINVGYTECILENPLILLTDYSLMSSEAIKFITKHNVNNSPLLIITPEIGEHALTELIEYNKKIPCCVIKNPSFPISRIKRLLEWTEDIAIFTGATLISKETGRVLKYLKLDDLGSVKKAIIKKNSTILLGGTGLQENINKQVYGLEEQAKWLKNDFDRERAKLRATQLTGNIIAIKVGGYTDYEVKYIKRLIEDALASCKSAIRKGVVAGTGLANLYALKQCSHNLLAYKIVEKALQEPFLTLTNGNKVLLNEILNYNSPYISYNVLTNKTHNMYMTGVLDTTETCQNIIKYAFSLASELISSQYIVIKERKI